MRNLRLPKTGARPAAAPLLTAPLLVLAVSLLGLAATPAAAQDATGGASCSQRYHASLGRIAKTEYPVLKAATRAPGTAEAGDPGLPGNFLFTPVSAGERTREETAALRYAAALARAKGRSGGGTDAGTAWMADRLRTALGDYLTQSPSPYLCSGVEDYVAELRGDARRLGPPPVRREALIAAQTAVVTRTVAAAFAAMKPVPLPQEKPADLPSGDVASQLRPSIDADRVDTSIATGSTTLASPEDPDLPKLKPEAPASYATSADLVETIDRLRAAATSGQFLTQTQTQATPTEATSAETTSAEATPAGGTPAISATAYPVLSRLQEIRTVVAGVRPAVTDRTVRLRLATALSAIEALDYLMRARTVVEDPVATAMDATFEAILKAHASDCTCRD